jgi:acetyl esterase/lipase
LSQDGKGQENGSLGAEVASLLRLVAKERETFGVTCVPGELPRASMTLRETYVALAALQLAKSRDYLSALPPDSGRAAHAVRVAQLCLRGGDRPRPPGCLAPGRVVEQAYFARNDGSPQPYLVYVPSRYSPARKHPLMLFLHGWVPDTTRINPWLPPDEMVALAEKSGVLLAVPHGRTNTDFQFAGEVDVLRVIAEMLAFCSVDADRVYLTGVSMGGAGVWQIAMHYPHIFAAVAPISPQCDWFKFWHEHFSYPVRAELPRHIEWIIGMHNPMDLARNLTSLPSLSQQSTHCFLGVDHCRKMAAALKEVGAPHRFFEDPSTLGHYIYFQPECWKRVFDELLPKRRERLPAKVRYITSSLRFPRAYWAEIAGLQKWGVPATLDVEHTGAGRIVLKTDNVAGVSLSPPVTWATGGLFAVTWNGKDLGQRKPDAGGRVVLDRPGAPEGVEPSLRKTRAVCGPVSDVMNHPFVLVRGTRGTKEETDALTAMARRFADDWYAYAEGRAAVIRDSEVTPALMRQRNLVLFGLPETNELVARIAPRLPFRLSRRAVTLPDGKTFPMEGTGLMLTYPNPLAPDRYVLVCHGIPWGEGRSPNHRFDLLPDFALYRAESLPGIGINRYLAAGLFDANWQYDPALTDFGMPEQGRDRP